MNDDNILKSKKIGFTFHSIAIEKEEKNQERRNFLFSTNEKK